MKNRQYITLSEGDIKSIINESVKQYETQVLNEGLKSNTLKTWFKQHGGVKRIYTEPEFSDLKDKRVYQDGLGDVTDDAIVYTEEFGSWKDASKKQWELTRPNPNTRQRSNWDMKAYFTIYKANDGTYLLVGIDRNKMKIGRTWGGEATKKTADRIMRNGWNMKTRSNRYVDDSDTYYYSDKGKYFGINNNHTFQGKMGDNENLRSQMSNDEWNDYQRKRVNRIKQQKRR